MAYGWQSWFHPERERSGEGNQPEQFSWDPWKWRAQTPGWERDRTGHWARNGRPLPVTHYGWPLAPMFAEPYERRHPGYRYAQEGAGDSRDFLDRAADEVYSWFGDEAASRRRREDHRGKGPKGYTRSDERIYEDVSECLTRDGHVDATEIEVSVSGGEVTLDGTVAERAQKRRAEDCADSVTGVRHTQNNLRIE